MWQRFLLGQKFGFGKFNFPNAENADAAKKTEDGILEGQNTKNAEKRG